jgi:hypothetical protein
VKEREREDSERKPTKALVFVHALCVFLIPLTSMKFLLAKLFESAKVSFCDRESKLFMTVVVEHKLFIIATYPTRNESLFLLISFFLKNKIFAKNKKLYQIKVHRSSYSLNKLSIFK